MKTAKQQLGLAGEDMAATYLEEKGYEIIERNFQAGQNEIDLICTDGHDLVIVEVKSARMPGYGQPEARISVFKQKSIIKATYIFLTRHKAYAGKNLRFDVVCVNLRTYPAGVAHYKAAFWQKRF